ncbi:MAG: restriction endonuclease subunit S domain-containing protein [Candidatus Dormibacteria bacterium]
MAAIRCGQAPSTAFHALDAMSSVWDPYQQEGTVFGSIGKQQLNALRIWWPDGDLGPLETKLSALDTAVEAIVSESSRVSAVRDTLLPKLLSGELKVRDAESLVEEAV